MVAQHQFPPAIRTAIALIPGVALCGAVTFVAFALERGEQALFGRAWLEALVLAILLGTIIRTSWAPGRRWFPGISFSAKFLLELAVVLLGASVSAATILAAGPWLLLGIAGVVIVAIGASFLLGRLLRLPTRMALLVACGNSICGNSAIAAVAPVIGADGDDVAASIGFTAVLGVIVVLALPLLGIALHLDGVQYGALAGLTVYAVPQVIAAAAPIGPTAVQMGTLVKLVRVLMLGPVCLLLSLLALREASLGAAGPRPRLHQLVPWFILAGADEPCRDDPHRRIDGRARARRRRAHRGVCRRTRHRNGDPVAPRAWRDQPRLHPRAADRLSYSSAAISGRLRQASINASSGRAAGGV